MMINVFTAFTSLINCNMMDSGRVDHLQTVRNGNESVRRMLKTGMFT